MNAEKAERNEALASHHSAPSLAPAGGLQLLVPPGVSRVNLLQFAEATPSAPCW